MDDLRNDFGQAAIIVGLNAAAPEADANVDLNNALTLATPEEPGGILSYSTYLTSVPCHRFQPDPSVPARYYVNKAAVESGIITALSEVEKPEHLALDPMGIERAPGTSRFVIVLAPVNAQDFRSEENDVIAGQRLIGVDKRNYHLEFAPTAVTVDPEHPVCPVAVVSLFAIADPQALLARLCPTADWKNPPIGPEIVRSMAKNGKVKAENVKK